MKVDDALSDGVSQREKLVKVQKLFLFIFVCRKCPLFFFCLFLYQR